MTVTVLYFASLRDTAGKAKESIDIGNDPDLTNLYNSLAKSYGFSLTTAQVKPAVNEAFCDWQTRLQAGDTIAFLPPVAGG